MPGRAGVMAGEAATAPRQRRMVGDDPLEPEQAQHAAAERLGLAQGDMEHQPQDQHPARSPDRRRAAVRRGCSGVVPATGERRLVEPERQVAAPAQPCLIRGPVRDAIARPWNTVTSGGVVLERQPGGVTIAASSGYSAPRAPKLATRLSLPLMSSKAVTSRAAKGSIAPSAWLDQPSAPAPGNGLGDAAMRSWSCQRLRTVLVVSPWTRSRERAWPARPCVSDGSYEPESVSLIEPAHARSAAISGSSSRAERSGRQPNRSRRTGTPQTPSIP